MRKIMIIVSIVLVLLSLTACETVSEEQTVLIDIEKIVLTKEGFEVTLNSDISSKVATDIIGFGVLYGVVDLGAKLTLNNYIGEMECQLHEETEYTFIFANIDEELFSKNISVVAYAVYEDDRVLYEEAISVFSMYDLAKQEETAFAKRISIIVEGLLISTIVVEVDTKSYIVSNVVDGYEVSLFTDYNIIRLTIIIDETYTLDDSIILTINNETISSKDWSYVKGNIVYEFDDPNWTPAY